jgi:serine protease AprX
VLTVGASTSLGTLSRKDDQVAHFSSRGPALGRIAKPDIVASGVGIESTIASGSSSELLLTCPVGIYATDPYMSLSGTSMAAPVVSGTRFDAAGNPNLTPNS